MSHGTSGTSLRSISILFLPTLPFNLFDISMDNSCAKLLSDLNQILLIVLTKHENSVLVQLLNPFLIVDAPLFPTKTKKLLVVIS